MHPETIENHVLDLLAPKIFAATRLLWFPCDFGQIDGETMETVTDFIFLGSKITVNGDCSHEIKRHLLLGKKAMTKLDNILKSRGTLCQKRPIYSKLWFSQ